MEEGKENDKSSWIKKEYGTALISLGSLAVQYLLPPQSEQPELLNQQEIRNQRINKFKVPRKQNVKQQFGIREPFKQQYDSDQQSSEDEILYLIEEQRKLDKLKQKQEENIQKLVNMRVSQQLEKQRIQEEKQRIQQLTDLKAEQLLNEQKVKQYQEDERLLNEIMKRRNEYK